MTQTRQSFFQIDSTKISDIYQGFRPRLHECFQHSLGAMTESCVSWNLDPSPSQLGGLGERCKLPQWGLGRSPSHQRFWCILDWKGSISCYINHYFLSICRLLKNEKFQIIVYEIARVKNVLLISVGSALSKVQVTHNINPYMPSVLYKIG